MHGSGFVILIFVISSLLIGAIIKIVMKNSPIPYTIVLLLVGIAMGVFHELGLFGEETLLKSMFVSVGHIDPHLILFLFLPTLIFESAYSMEPHLFFRIAPQIVLLAVAGLIISMILTAFAVSWLLSWSMGVALLFGALISATDPVSVVALLKEKSSRKRLETLIEGESLLNDGTAIVFFSLFYGFALGTTTEVSSLALVGEFIWVVAAGLFIGLIVGWIILWQIGKIINQPLVEITLTIVGAYVTFAVAESIHVSGVVALVSLALMFSTVGRMKISPEISHFLHQFWEVMTYIANTLIFLVVGIIIATYVDFESPEMFLILAVLYILLMLIRAVSVWVLMPILAHIGVGITNQKATVLVWSGLRGAVALSLALSIAQDSRISEGLREEILFLTAGVVFLSMVINGSTMEWLLHLLKLDRLPPAKEASVNKAKLELDKEMGAYFNTLIHNPFFKRVEVSELESLVSKKTKEIEPVEKLSEDELEIAFIRRLLEIERSDYWRQFEEGYIGRKASFILTKSVEQALDNQPVISPREVLDESFKVPSLPKWLQELPLMGEHIQAWLFTHLSLNYDVARGFVEAQEEMRRHILSLEPNPEIGAYVDSLIKKNINKAFSFTQYINNAYPELIVKLQKKSAHRLLINHKRSLIWKMEHDGVLEAAEAQHLVDLVEIEMSKMKEAKK